MVFAINRTLQSPGTHWEKEKIRNEHNWHNYENYQVIASTTYDKKITPKLNSWARNTNLNNDDYEMNDKELPDLYTKLFH